MEAVRCEHCQELISAKATVCPCCRKAVGGVHLFVPMLRASFLWAIIGGVLAAFTSMSATAVVWVIGIGWVLTLVGSVSEQKKRRDPHGG
ncbi:MAG: hypothetical protein KGL39_28205 [Patescibacteria group bacterium]|nr:hypothetical protein [Patescibacteria group bacterium]